ncbi:hypothetical protein DICPUDRAFT_155156 [Dictyostelium purpureum]|uniref:Ras GTPase-activating protein n=1 Tax=Dictyostelium purpureum TaxID=5786 RepID=F0ZT79_DICPU|nr:uncharacterized protein DICPUDRAFT_155156 [Dictyostelium purpureum]EGC32845.1 hypothetical protein DICPUDRAFT_155156 [Dictyostelium purpureum]|eukprot:XP_003290630.1 hypothetical protein DICPUDRAFT_155156 [Dictyostelium purpureum]
MEKLYGKVSIKILGARDILPLDITTSDPYCLIQTKDLNDIPTSPVFKTEVIYKTLNPVWKEEEFIFDIYGTNIVHILMYDEDKISKDDFAGLVRVNLDEYRNKGLRDIWIPLEGKNPKKPSKKKRGDIHLQINFSSFLSLSHYLNFDNHKIIKDLSKQLITDDFAKALMFYFSNSKACNLIDIIRDITSLEIENTVDPNVLFRTDSLSTKIIVATFKSIGYNFLREALTPLIRSMIENDVKLEVDTNKVSEAQSQQNSTQLTFYCSSFITAIKASMDQLPNEIKVICNLLYELILKKFSSENTSIKAVGGFLFLRFINPAIFSPEAFGLISDAPNPNVRRTLTLVSKVLQNISNQVTVTKEKDLLSFNPFITERFADLSNIIKQISTEVIDMPQQQFDFPLLQIEPITLMRHIDCIISSINDKKSFYSNNTSIEFNNEIITRAKLIQAQLKQQSKIQTKK